MNTPSTDPGASTPAPLGRLVAVTVAVADLPNIVEAYRAHLGYRLLESAYVPAALAQSWAAPQNAEARYGVMTPPGNTGVSLRFVEGLLPETYRPLRTFGWAAVEIVVADVDGLARSLAGSPFVTVSPPADLAFGDGALRAMTVRGPAQEILIFTQIRRALPGYDLPIATDPVDRPFIAVAAAEDLGKVRAFYRDKFQRPAGPEVATPIRGVNDAFDLEPTERHQMTTIALPGESYIEIDQYPEMTAKRRGVRGYLVPGIAMATFETPGVDDLPLYWLGEPSRFDIAPYGGRRQVTCYGAAGELIELIETD
ncbi:MAG: hypothetical protein RID42_01360 [Alphaproteobacteria bacterium]